MDLLKTLALGMALGAGTVAAAFIGLSCFQLLIRTAIHNWKLDKAAPDILSWSLGAFKVTLGERVAESAQKTADAIEGLQREEGRLDREIVRLLARVIELERKP